MSDGECRNPVHGNFRPRFSQSETHCHVCRGPKWKWASWSSARANIRVLVAEIAAFERGRRMPRFEDSVHTRCRDCGDERSRSAMEWDAECGTHGPFCRKCNSENLDRLR